MNQRQVNNAIRTAAKAVNLNGTYVPGRLADGSLWYDTPGDQILNTSTSKRKRLSNTLDSIYTITMYFTRQDDQANTPAAEYDNTINPSERDPGATSQALDSREELLADMDEMIDDFLKLLAEVKGVNIIDNSINSEEGTMLMSGGRTGYVLTFQLSTSNGYCNVQ